MPRTCESPLPAPSSLTPGPPLLIYLLPHSIRKLSENCGKEWEEHWQCLEKHNQELYMCRKPERTLNQCVFDKLVSHSAPPAKENKTICFCSVLTRLAGCCLFPFVQKLAKKIPGSPEGQPQIHEKKNPIWSGVQR